MFYVRFQNPSDYMIQTYLEMSKVIAVVGLSDREETTSNRISKIMQGLGYQIIPVNSKLAGQKILGETAYARLQDIPISVDIVNVFRRSEFLPDVARDFIETDAKIFGRSWDFKVKKRKKFCGWQVAIISS